jgi:adenylate cyclase
MAEVRGEAKPAGRERRFRLSLAFKLSLVVAALLMATNAVVGFFLARGEQHNLSAQMEKRGLTIAQNLANNAKNPLLANDDLTLSLFVQDVMKDPDVVYVAFTDPEGRIVAHPDLAQVGRKIERPAELGLAGAAMQVRPYVDAKLGRVLDFSVPLVFTQVPVGALYLGFSQGAIDQALAGARRQTVFITAIMVALGVAGAVGVAALVTRPVRRLVGGTRAIAKGDFKVSIPVTSRDELGTLTESFNQMVQSLREKEMIKRAFTRYVAREVVDEILKDPERMVLKEERRDVTVLFCDVRGFTPLAERLSPEGVVLLLNEFYTLMIDTTFKNDGTLDKFLGDGVMAIFGAPILHPDHSLRAVKTALAMQAGISELSRRRAAEGKDPIMVGIGLSAGEAVAGTVGTEDRMEYTVIGDSVNLAARLESNAKAGQILISQRTYRNVEGLVNVKSLGMLKVKGKEEQVEVYEVLGLATAV